MQTMNRAQTRGVRNKKSTPIGFGEWSLKSRTQFDELLEGMVEQLHDRNTELLEKFNNLLDVMLQEGFRIATEQYECVVMFETITPLVLNIQLPIGAQDYEGPEWNFDLSEMIKNEIEGCQENMDGEARGWLVMLRDELNKSVLMIDEVLGMCGV
jgi:hypothetical protein